MRTSPEFACKKLLAAGETRIFEFARVFRDRERGDLHLPEFTMLEWYRADGAYDAIMADTIVVIAHAAQATGIRQFSFRGKICDPFAEPELLTVAAAFERFAGIDLLATVADGEGDRAALASAAQGKVRITADDTWSDIFSKLLVEHVEPNLGQGRLTVLFEYPTPEAALARAKPSDPRVAERFEFFSLPDYQANAKVPKSVSTGFKGRGLPDVTADADPNTGYNVRVDGEDFVIGGTSAVAPLMAGLVALVNQKNNSKAGFINPKLYAVHGLCRDITEGDNIYFYQ